ncbi:MAG: PQQ-binding-like beta-propeller repeat protein [Polyangiaceae bacterium]|nr:PQQ-binding-like beta-propeller repeat protein [Polyangiaceae bacterium]
MSSLTPDEMEPQGLLSAAWKAQLPDYAINGGWTKESNLLIAADSAGGLHAFDGSSGESVWSRAQGHAPGILALSLSPNGEVVATAGQDGHVKIWRAETGEVLQEHEVGKGWVEQISWSSDSKALAVVSGKEVIVWGVDGQKKWQSAPHPSTVSALVWSNAGELATACYGRVTFFDGESGKETQQLEWKGSLVSIILSPDGDIVACGSQDKSVHFWRRSTEEDSMMSGYRAKPTVLSFDETGTLLATGGGTSVSVWSFYGDGPEGTSPGILEAHVRPISALAFAPRLPLLASGARDAGVIIWMMEKDGQGRPVGAALTTDTLTALIWRPDGQALAALDARGGVHVWKTETDA